MTTRYIHQLPQWPDFHWNTEKLTDILSSLRYRQGKVMGRMETLSTPLRQEAMLQTLALDVLKSSEIEGEFLPPEPVRSAIARRLGITLSKPVPSDRTVDGIVEMMLDATQHFSLDLTEERLFGWHMVLFPRGTQKAKVGGWRSHSKERPKRVVSGPPGMEQIHFEAPEAGLMKQEMTKFLVWFNHTRSLNPVIKAGVAHLWFLTVHPFDDGSGRMARAITDLQLARAEDSSQRFYSMSAQLRKERSEYLDILEKTQKGTLDITDWLAWFLGCLDRSLIATDTTLHQVLSKARFWDKVKGTSLNDRQRLMINLLLDNFEGKLTSSLWAQASGCSHDTALRDIAGLVEGGILMKDMAGGRSTHYSLKNLLIG